MLCVISILVHNSAEFQLLTGKLRRVEEERRDYFEEMARLNDLLKSHEAAAASSTERIAELESELGKVRQALSDNQQGAALKLQVQDSSPCANSMNA